MFPPRNTRFPTLNFRQSLHAPQLVGNLLVVVLWLALYRAMGDYLGVIALREDFRTNQLVLIGIAALIAFQIYTKQFRLQFHTAPRLYPLPLALALGGSLAYLIVERWLSINTVSATLFGIATYGLLGLWLSPRSWRDGLPAALLVIGVLPFGEHMQTFIGYPMRIVTAELVRDFLSAFHITNAGVDTILVLENGVSQIDLPCSGVKSLWTGALFFLAVTWLERRALNLRWLLVAVAFVLLLFVANLIRVGMLVVAAQVLNLTVIADLIHVPLGVLGFVTACAAAVWLLRYKNNPIPLQSDSIPTASSSLSFRPSEAKHILPFLKSVLPCAVRNLSHINQNFTGDSPFVARWLTPALCIIIALMAFFYAARPETGLAQTAPDWKFPAALRTQPLPLKPDEYAWLTRDGADSATRLRFEWQGLTGSMILVPSRTWRAHHRPERCFEVFGLTLNDSRAQLVSESFPIRAVTLRDPNSDLRLNAAYWFQSAARVTDDYGTRIWADTTAPSERWVLVSILFDQPIEPTDPRAIALYQILNDAVAQQFD